MKRILFILALLIAALVCGGCRFAVVEDDDVQVIGCALFSAFAEETVAEDAGEPEVVRLYSRDTEEDTRVSELQQALRRLGYLAAGTDGYFGELTQDALLAFQREYGIAQTGLLDERTAFMLQSALLEVTPEPEEGGASTSAPEPTPVPKPTPIVPGAVSEDVKLVQRLLGLYGFYEHYATGIYDDYTQEAVEAFQRYCVAEYGTEFDVPEQPVANLLPPKGNEDASNAQAFAHGIPEMEAPTPEPTLRPDYDIDGTVTVDLYNYLAAGRFPIYRRTVQFGDYGGDVRRVQSRLTMLDYFYGDLTGDYDAVTGEALKLFQKRNDLQATGIADAETQAKLFSADAAALEAVDQPFYIKVSLEDQRVYVYRWIDGDYTYLCRTMICSSGAPNGHETPTGVFVSPGHRDGRWHYFVKYECWAQYAFVIEGDILFHSVTFSERDESTLRKATVSALGRAVSHGCIRLSVDDAKWIYEHCGIGQVIEIY